MARLRLSHALAELILIIAAAVCGVLLLVVGISTLVQKCLHRRSENAYIAAQMQNSYINYKAPDLAEDAPTFSSYPTINSQIPQPIATDFGYAAQAVAYAPPATVTTDWAGAEQYARENSLQMPHEQPSLGRSLPPPPALAASTATAIPPPQYGPRPLPPGPATATERPLPPVQSVAWL